MVEMTEQNQQIEGLDRIIIETLGKTPKSMRIPILMGNKNHFQLAARKENLMENLKELGYHNQKEIEERLDYHINEGNLVAYRYQGKKNIEITLIAAHPNVVKKHKIVYDM